MSRAPAPLARAAAPADPELLVTPAVKAWAAKTLDMRLYAICGLAGALEQLVDHGLAPEDLARFAGAVRHISEAIHAEAAAALDDCETQRG